jgi:dihydrofolate reductase
MAIIYDGREVAASFTNLQETDFSKVTAHPEFVAKGKTFYDETGQLQEGTAEFMTILGAHVEGETLIFE